MRTICVHLDKKSQNCNSTIDTNTVVICGNLIVIDLVCCNFIPALIYHKSNLASTLGLRLLIHWERHPNNFISNALKWAICISSSSLSLLRFLFSSMSSSRWFCSSTAAAVAVTSLDAFRYAGKALGSPFFRVISTSRCLAPFWNFSCWNSHLLEAVFLNP